MVCGCSNSIAFGLLRPRHVLLESRKSNQSDLADKINESQPQAGQSVVPPRTRRFPGRPIERFVGFVCGSLCCAVAVLCCCCAGRYKCMIRLMVCGGVSG